MSGSIFGATSGVTNKRQRLTNSRSDALPSSHISDAGSRRDGLRIRATTAATPFPVATSGTPVAAETD
eukprot:scaffold3388_cov62-Attheya_sp.AAC.1